jgi:3-keto-L-gulonate-6-phosphate decarboxylase
MSFHPLALYDRDSDDSSSEGGFSDHHVAMGIANDRCDDDSAYSLDSDLFTDAGNDEMDGTGLEGNFNPQNLRIEAGKRVGIDTDDESDGDGEHGLYHRDRDVGIRGMDSRGMRGAVGSVSSGSFSAGNSSDDDIDWNMRGNGKNQTWIKDDQVLDDEMPVGSARAGLVVDAGQPSTMMDAEELQHARGEADKGERAKEDKAKEGVARNKSRALVQEALAKARATKNPTTKAFLERRADILARGTETGKKVIVGGVLKNERSGQVLAPSVRAKGQSALQVLAKPSIAKGRLVGGQMETKAQGTARANEESRRMYSGEHQHQVKKAVERVRKFVAGNIKTIKNTAQQLKAGRQEREAEVVAGQKAEQKHYTEVKIAKFFASKGLARLRQATRESKLKKILLNEKATVVTRFIRLAVAKGVLERARAEQLDRDLKALAKGRGISDDEDAEEKTQTLAGGKSVASDPRGSVLSTAMAGGGGAEAPAGAPVRERLNADQVARISAEGGFVHREVNAVIMNGNRIMVNGQKLTSNRVNLPAILELITSLTPYKTHHKKLWTALNKAKSMIDGGKGNGKAQSTVVLALPPVRKLKKAGGGGAE